MNAKWATATLGELTANRPICYGVLKPGPRQTKGVPLIRITDITNDAIDESNLYLITQKLSDEFRRSVLRGGEVLLSIQGTIGRVAICPEHLRGANISRTIALIAPDERIFRPFLRYWLLSKEDCFPTCGSTRASLNIGAIRELKAPIPPVSEQRRIVAILDKAFEGIATAKANAERNLRNAREVFRSRVANAFSDRNAAWIDTTIESLAENLDSKRIPITKNKRLPGDYPYYGASGIVDYVKDYIFEGHCLLVSEDGANLLARSTPIAFSVSGKYWVNNHAHILRFPEMATQRYVEFYFESIPIDRYVTGAAQPKLTQKAMNAIPIPIPVDLQERQRIVDLVTSMDDNTAAVADIVRQKIIALDELKASLLHQAFTGQL